MGYFKYVDNAIQNMSAYIKTTYPNPFESAFGTLNLNTPQTLGVFGFGYGGINFPQPNSALNFADGASYSAPSIPMPVFNLSAAKYNSYTASTAPLSTISSSSAGNNVKINDSNSDLKPGLFKGRLAG